MEAAVVFDLDDTLYLERDFVRSGFRAVDAWLAREHGRDGFLERAWALFEAGTRGTIFDRALEELGIAPQPDLIQRLIQVYRGHEPEIQLLPDAARALERCCAAGIRVALLTDGWEAVQRRKIEALGIVPRCAPIICTDAWGRDFWKPHLRGFRMIQEHFGRPPEAFVYIADNPAKDFIGPRRLGWRTVRLRRPEGLYAKDEAAPGADAEVAVESLDDIDLVGACTTGQPMTAQGRG